MSADFQPILVKDSRIGQITDNVKYGVASGASSNTYQRFVSTSASTSNISWNVQIPSESIVVSRDILIECTVNFKLNITGVANGQDAFLYGTNDCFQAFPVNSLFSTLQATINNTSVSVNLQDIKDSLLCMMSTEDLAKYQGMTPYVRDNYQQYRLSNATSNDVFNGYQGGDLDGWFLPRGAHPLVSYTVVHSITGGGQDTSVRSTNINDSWVISISAKFTEPLMLSPFLFGGCYDYNNQGFVGLNTLSIVANVDSSLKRFFSSKDRGYVTSISLDQQNPFTADLLLNFLTTQPTDLVKAKNVIQFFDYPRYITGTSNLPPIPAFTSSTISCQNIQLNQVPEYLMIFVRKPMTQQTIFDSATFLPITGISVNFNNSSGLLSTASQYDLWRISRKNGCQLSWLEWIGRASLSRQYSVTNVNAEALAVSTVGSVLVLSPAYDLSLPSYLSNGSLGQFSFQINLSVFNNAQDTQGAGVQVQPEVVVVAVNSGLFTTIAGNSATYTGVLTKDMVLSTSQSGEEVDRNEYERLVGGSMANRVANAIKSLIPRRKPMMVTHSSAPNRRIGSKLDSFT